MSDEQDSRFNKAAKLLKCLVKVLLSVYNSEVGGLLQIGHESLGILIVKANFLGENSGCLVGFISL